MTRANSESRRWRDLMSIPRRHRREGRHVDAGSVRAARAAGSAVSVVRCPCAAARRRLRWSRPRRPRRRSIGPNPSRAGRGACVLLCCWASRLSQRTRAGRSNASWRFYGLSCVSSAEVVRRTTSAICGPRSRGCGCDMCVRVQRLRSTKPVKTEPSAHVHEAQRGAPSPNSHDDARSTVIGRRRRARAATPPLDAHPPNRRSQRDAPLPRRRPRLPRHG